MNAKAFNQPLNLWDVSNVKYMNRMFLEATLFNQDISMWDVSSVLTRPPIWFSDNSALTLANSPRWFPVVLDANGITIKYVGSSSLVPTSSALFIHANPRGTGNEWFAVVKQGMRQAITEYANGTSSAPFERIPGDNSTLVPFNNIVTSLMTDMSYMFNGATTFNSDISGWDTSLVTTMYNMFRSAAAFNQPLNSWNTGAVTDMSFMFNNAAAFNQNLSGWDVALTLTRPSLIRNNFADNSPLALSENSNKLPLFE